MTEKEFFIQRLEEQAEFWDRTKMPTGLIWWWLQGAQYCAVDDEWEALSNLQQVVSAIEEGRHETK